jgi:hypothetical protein
MIEFACELEKLKLSIASFRRTAAMQTSLILDQLPVDPATRTVISRRIMQAFLWSETSKMFQRYSQGWLWYRHRSGPESMVPIDSLKFFLLLKVKQIPTDWVFLRGKPSEAVSIRFRHFVLDRVLSKQPLTAFPGYNGNDDDHLPALEDFVSSLVDLRLPASTIEKAVLPLNNISKANKDSDMVQAQAYSQTIHTAAAPRPQLRVAKYASEPYCIPRGAGWYSFHHHHHHHQLNYIVNSPPSFLNNTITVLSALLL